MEKTKKKTLTVPRQKKLKKEFPNGEAVGRAFVQFYLDQKRKKTEPKSKPALNNEEMDFLRSTVYATSDKKAFKPYYILEQVLHQFEYWIDRHEQVFYHGLFKNLSVIQTPDYDIQIYHLLMYQRSPDKNSIEKAKVRYTKSLVPITNILMPNWNNLIANSLKELYNYSFRLEKIQELTKFDFSPIIPDMEHHEKEVLELQRVGKIFRRNLGHYIKNFDFDVNDNVIEKLEEFITINIETLRLNEEEKEENIQKALMTVEMIRGATNE